MGYGVGIFLLALGLILALAVTDSISSVDLTLVGWILAAVGVLAIVLTAATTANRNRHRTTSVTTHSDGSQTVHEHHNEPPAV